MVARLGSQGLLTQLQIVRGAGKVGVKGQRTAVVQGRRAHVAELRRAVSRARVVVRRAGAGGAGEKLLKVCQGGARPSSRAVARPAI